MTVYSETNISRLMRVSEHAEQASFFNWLLLFKEREHPEVHPLFFSVPNGANLAGSEKQKAIQMRKLKKEGLTPGVADTLFLSGRGGYLGMALEFKAVDKAAAKDGGLSEPQQEFLQAARMEGYKTDVAYGADHAERIVSEYLAMPRTQDLVWKALRAAERSDLESVKETLQEIVLKW